MQVSAYLKSVRISPRKVRLVAGLVKGLDAYEARDHLSHLAKRSVQPLVKLLDSALANAYNNHGLARDNMKVSAVVVDGAQVLKRYRPKGFGSASPIAKRTAHVRIILEEKVPGLKAQKIEKPKEEPEVTKTEIKAAKQEKPEIKKEIGAKKSTVGAFTKRLFRRKSI